MPSHRKAKRKKTGATGGGSVNARTSGDTPRARAYAQKGRTADQKDGPKTIRPRARTTKPRNHRRKGEMAGPPDYTQPADSNPRRKKTSGRQTPHRKKGGGTGNERHRRKHQASPKQTAPNKGRVKAKAERERWVLHLETDREVHGTRFIRGGSADLLGFERALSCLMTSAQPPTLPPHRIREVPGGYTFSTEFLDAVEALHQARKTGEAVDHAPTQRRTRRLDLERGEVEIIRRHMARRLRRTHDNLLKSIIMRRQRFEEAAAGLEYELPKIAGMKKQRKALRATTEAVLRAKLLQRDYRRILLVAVMTALRSERGEPQQRHPGNETNAGDSRVRQRLVPPGGSRATPQRGWHPNREQKGTAWGRIRRWETTPKNRDRANQGRLRLWERKKKSRWRTPIKVYQTGRSTATRRILLYWETRQKGRWKRHDNANRHEDRGREASKAFLAGQPWLVPPWHESESC